MKSWRRIELWPENRSPTCSGPELESTLRSSVIHAGRVVGSASSAHTTSGAPGTSAV
jgi:hypothetical protein